MVKDKKLSWAGTASVIALPVFLIACSTSSNTDISTRTLSQATETVELKSKEADSITANDVINRKKDHVRRTGEIYMMRGLANVFSRGIDSMTAELRSRNYDVANFSHAQWEPIAANVAQRASIGGVSFPIVIVGHSLGGNESSKFANYLASREVPVALIVAFDPVEQNEVGPKIKHVINYYLPKDQQNKIVAGLGFTGKLENIDVTTDPEISHMNVDKNQQFQQRVYQEIAKITKAKKPKKSKVYKSEVGDR